MEALLLFAAPEVFTLQKLLSLVALGERSHQFAAVAGDGEAHPAGLSEIHPKAHVVLRSLSLFSTFVKSAFSASISSPSSSAM